jgi:aromatase
MKMPVHQQDEQVHTAEHAIDVRASAEAVYDVIADVAAWPLRFAPTVHVEYLARDGREERIRIWATANGEVKTWVSRRVLDPQALRIEFRQEVSQAPVAAMGGAWTVQPVSEHACKVVLSHDFRAVPDDPDAVTWISRAVDHNSEHELAGIKTLVEQGASAAELLLSFEDAVQIEAGISDVYRFLYSAADWPELLPHVSRLDLTETVPGVQTMEMETVAADGSMHTTASVRICFPENRIVYKQTAVPRLMTLHTGEWRLTEQDGGVLAVAAHTVSVNREAIEPVLGADSTVADAHAYLRRVLGTNSTTTLRNAKEYAESRATA